jgi:hypothetical protein
LLFISELGIDGYCTSSSNSFVAFFIRRGEKENAETPTREKYSL